jgi:putative oxidoreductase
VNIVLWILQGVIALFCIMGSIWRFNNYEQASKDVPSLNALSYGVWNAIGAFEIICALGLILPGVLKMKPILTPVAAACLAVEMLLVTGLHVKFFGFQVTATNPATWSFMLAVLVAFVAYGRYALHPL